MWGLSHIKYDKCIGSFEAFILCNIYPWRSVIIIHVPANGGTVTTVSQRNEVSY